MSGYPLPKRILDKIVALVLLILLALVFLAVVATMGLSMLIHRGDRGGWLYREPRISRGQIFDLLKFRTLRVDVLREIGSRESHIRLQEADERNLTWAGRRLLKPWYLDELPQLWNVLRGDMSLVGPRPWPPSMVETQVASGVTYRREFVAGWTGPAQVAKGITESAGYTELDAEYVNAWRTSGFLLMVRRDVGYLWRTAVVMAKGEGLRF